MVSAGGFGCGCTFLCYQERNTYNHICWWHRNIQKGRLHNMKFEFKKDKPCVCGCE